MPIYSLFAYFVMTRKKRSQYNRCIEIRCVILLQQRRLINP